MEKETVRIHNKDYETVASRINRFRDKCPLWSIQTKIVEADDKIVVMSAEIFDDTGRLISTGHAEENRNAGKINKTSALENCETSAVGRALAFFGMGGTEIASADEVANAINAAPVVRTPKKDARDEWRETWIRNVEALGIDPGAEEALVDKVESAYKSGNHDDAKAIMDEVRAMQ